MTDEDYAVAAVTLLVYLSCFVGGALFGFAVWTILEAVVTR